MRHTGVRIHAGPCGSMRTCRQTARTARVHTAKRNPEVFVSISDGRKKKLIRITILSLVLHSRYKVRCYGNIYRNCQIL